jgi:hypothetical protein
MAGLFRRGIWDADARHKPGGKASASSALKKALR